MDYVGTNNDDILDQKQLKLPPSSNIYGLAGNDLIQLSDGHAIGGAGNDTIIGSVFWDEASYRDSPSGVSINLVTGKVQDGFGTVDTIKNVNFFESSGKGDFFIGNSANNRFWSRSYLDRMDGGIGIDQAVISINDSKVIPEFTKTKTGWTIRYQDGYGGFKTLETTSVELLSIYRGGLKFEDWDLSADVPYLVPDPQKIFQPVSYLAARDQWQIRAWGIESLTFTENTGAWYYPTPNDYKRPGNITPDMQNAALGDFNGDGYQDIVISLVVFPHVIPHETRPMPTILWGSALGLVKADINTLPPTVVRHMAYRTFKANLNGDGVDDFVTGAMQTLVYTDSNKTIIKEESAPTLAVTGASTGQLKDISNQLQGQSLTLGSPTSSFDHTTAVGDLNRDGLDDIFSGNTLWVSNRISGWDDQTKKVSALLPYGSPMSLAIGDLNNDDAQDILALYPNFQTDRVILFNGIASDLQFRRSVLPAGLYGENTKDNFAIIADVNYDGLNDIVVAETRALPYYIGSAIQILIQRSPGVFVDETDSRINNTLRDQVQGEGQLFFVDVNGDGFKDIVHSGDGDGLAVFINDGNGLFSLYDNKEFAAIKKTQLDGFQTIYQNEYDESLYFHAFPVDDNHDGIMDWVVQARKPGVTFDPNEDQQVVLYLLVSTGKEFGRDQSEQLRGSNYDDVIYGLGGNDVITGRGGNDTLDGGAGIDTAVFRGNRAAATITKTASGYTVSGGTDNSDSLINVERLRFSDKTVALDINGTAGQAYRVYQAAFNRTPDNSGLKYWIGLMDGGVSLPTVSSAFIASAEFKALYGANPTNEVFISKLYDNVLHRAPDQGGYDYWVDLLKTNKIDSISTLINFSESAENQAGVIGVIQNGIDLLS